MSDITDFRKCVNYNNCHNFDGYISQYVEIDGNPNIKDARMFCFKCYQKLKNNQLPGYKLKAKPILYEKYTAAPLHHQKLPEFKGLNYSKQDMSFLKKKRKQLKKAWKAPDRHLIIAVKLKYSAELLEGFNNDPLQVAEYLNQKEKRTVWPGPNKKFDKLKIEALTKTEQSILYQINAGKTQNQIAQTLRISQRMVSYYYKRIKEKLSKIAEIAK